MTAQNVRPSRFQILPQALRDQERRFSGKSPTLLRLSVFGNALLDAVVYCAVQNFASVLLLLYSAGCSYQIIFRQETTEFVCLSMGAVYFMSLLLVWFTVSPFSWIYNSIYESRVTTTKRVHPWGIAIVVYTHTLTYIERESMYQICTPGPLHAQDLLTRV